MPDQITVSLPDGSKRTLDQGTTTADLAASIGSRLAKDAVAAVVDGQEVDLNVALHDGDAVAIVTVGTEEGRHVLRHSTAHVLAQAVTQLWPGAKFAIGPPIENGFYYDFDLPGGAHFLEEDLERIEERMRDIIKADQPFVREVHTIDEGLALFADQPYKCEIIQGVESASEGAGDGVITAYRNSPEFVDMCRGPHVPSTGKLGFFKLMRVAGAYWRGDEHNQQLQRIYGTAWESKKALAEHLERLEEAENRDHRKLGAELDLFSFPTEIGSGLPVFHPKGGTVRRLMEDYSRQRHEEAGYEFVYTPHVTKSSLFETSGHLQWFADGMFPPMELEGVTYYAKPMNCPFHALIFRSRGRSYRELPLRMFEFGTVYRYEKSGVIHGLTRVRGMTQDDSHIFCTREQMEGELTSLLKFVLDLLRDFGLDDFYLELSTKPEGKAAGTDDEWEDAINVLATVAESEGLDLVMDPGGGAFYGPKISVQARDAIGRTWQMSTIQLDFQQPKNFELTYDAADGSRQAPVMIHRALFGSVERFFGVLVEHYAGAFPAWLAPVQVAVLPVGADFADYAQHVHDRLRAEGFRVELNAADEPLGARIRRMKLQKLPYILVVGADDVGAGTVGVNARGSERPERDVSVDEFIARLHAEVDSHAIESMSIDRLWAGWRNAYVSGVANVAPVKGECVFCGLLAADDVTDRERLVVHRGERVVAILNLYPYGSGHLLVLPIRHLANLHDLDADERTELFNTLIDASDALQTAYGPDGMNVGANLGRAAGAGVPGHLHLHALPRWSGDTNFMTTVGETRVINEDLATSYDKVQAAWPQQVTEP